MTERLGNMSLHRGISVQTCFLSEASVSQTVDLLYKWDPSSHPSLNILRHQSIKLPIDPADFSMINLSADKATGHWLIEKTSNSGILSNLYLSSAEAQKLPNPSTPAAIDQFWSTLLQNRASAFFTGGFKSLPNYDFSGASYSPEDELKALLLEVKPVAAQFSSLLDQTIFSAQPSASSSPPVAYWELLAASGEGTLNLGATFFQSQPQFSQVVDCEYYANSNYFVNLILYQIWPLQYQGKDCSLVWRCDLISSPTLAEYRGVERMAASNLTIQDVKEAIRSFQEDVRNKK